MNVKLKPKFILSLIETKSMKPLESILQFTSPLNFLNLIDISKTIRERIILYPITKVL